MKDEDNSANDQPWRPEDAEGDWEWNEEDFLEEENEADPEPTMQRRWLRPIILGIVALALVGNVMAIIPLIFNSNVIQFLKVTNELSKDEALQAYKQAIVVVEAGDRKGTGFNIAANGIIVTNEHVVGNALTAVIGFPDDQIFHADVVAIDPEADLAILKVKKPPEAELPLLNVSLEQSWSEGMLIYYFGNPLFFNHIIGQGAVLGLTEMADKPMPIMLIDAPIYKGNSGSPVLNAEGDVIAVIYATTEIMQNGQRLKAGLAIPTNHPFFTHSDY